MVSLLAYLFVSRRAFATWLGVELDGFHCQSFAVLSQAVNNETPGWA
jgi:hypothetical protein